MTDTATIPVVPSVQPAPLQMLGGAAAFCEGDFCEIPGASDQAIVNDMVDSDNI